MVYIDTEGFEASGKSDAYDDRIFALSTVIASVLVYNLPGTKCPPTDVCCVITFCCCVMLGMLLCMVMQMVHGAQRLCGSQTLRSCPSQLNLPMRSSASLR